MKQKHNKKPSGHVKIAKERIEELFELAGTVSEELSDRYVELARKIAMKYKVTIPSTYKRRFCKHCFKYFVPGRNGRVRLNRGKLVYYCLSCKKFARLPLKQLRTGSKS